MITAYLKADENNSVKREKMLMQEREGRITKAI